MASTSNTSPHPQLEDVSAPSTSASAGSSSTSAFVVHKNPSTKLPLPRNKRYHVFLSFRGPDVREKLVKNLFRALDEAGLHVFLDSEKLEKGEIIKLSLEEAIKSSLIRIPIFSKCYAESTWCLREAALISASTLQDIIIPLFYHIDPTDVRFPVNEKSPYRKAFDKHYGHKDRQATEEVNQWTKALEKICSHSGWSVDTTEGSEDSIVKTVVSDLLKRLQSLPLNAVPLVVAKHPVGLDRVKNTLIQSLNLNSEEGVVKVGIWGIGGVGKTTLAKAVYNDINCNFKACFFAVNVSTTAEARGLIKLQKQILRELVNYDGKVYSVDEGKTLLKDRLSGTKVLLILDDMDADEQVDALVGDWFAPGSRVMITSRDKHVLNVAKVPSRCIHAITGLERDESLSLFSWHAFGGASPSPDYKDLSIKIVNACHGHPLSLEVIGSFLQDKKDDIGCWKDALHNITLNPGIHERLKISYNSLSDEEKEIFVDIACLFIGEHKKFPIRFWKSMFPMVDTAVKNLSMKSLIKIDRTGVLDMHDHLRDMGRTIAQKEKEGTRIWRSADFSTLSSKTNISRLRLKGGNPQSLEMVCRPGLRYLHLENLFIQDVTEETITMLPTTLIWLRLEGCNYAIGENRATKKPLYSRFVNNVWQLKIVELKGISWFGTFPISSLFGLPNIQVQYMDLEMTDSYNLKYLPDAIGNLSNLKHLNLRPYVNLISLPYTIGNMSQLQQLNLEFCSKLQNLPDTIGDLSQLQQLNLRGLFCLKNLPDTIGKMSQLQHLNLGWSSSLENLPHTIGNLSQLQHLDLKRCYRLNNLPNTINKLLQLKHLDLYFCSMLKNLPKTIGNLSQLQHLDLGICVNLKSLPDSIGELSQLQQLNLRECFSLENLPNTIGDLAQLQHLNLERCYGLNVLPDTIGNLSRLQYLYLRECNSLNNLPDTIGDLSQLKHLDLRGCYRLKSLPNTICELSQLEHLDLIWCNKLSNLPDSIAKLSQLKSLYWKDKRTWEKVMEGRN